MDGSAVSFSIASSSVRDLEGSKILPQVANLVAQTAVCLFQFFDHYARSVLFLEMSAMNTLSAIIAQSHANQSP
jgi:hypothetical protein